MILVDTSIIPDAVPELCPPRSKFSKDFQTKPKTQKILIGKSTD